ncbi:hypothetical protein EDB61_101590 [Vibrio crassostreae]|nr:hypothetical protein EDB61_101590 [Vibrio crassostreae]
MLVGVLSHLGGFWVFRQMVRAVSLVCSCSILLMLFIVNPRVVSRGKLYLSSSTQITLI